MRSLFPSVLFDAKTLRPSRKRRKSAEARAYIKISGTRPSVRPSRYRVARVDDPVRNADADRLYFFRARKGRCGKADVVPTDARVGRVLGRVLGRGRKCKKKGTRAFGSRLVDRPRRVDRSGPRARRARARAGSFVQRPKRRESTRVVSDYILEVCLFVYFAVKYDVRFEGGL